MCLTRLFFTDSKDGNAQKTSFVARGGPAGVGTMDLSVLGCVQWHFFRRRDLEQFCGHVILMQETVICEHPRKHGGLAFDHTLSHTGARMSNSRSESLRSFSLAPQPTAFPALSLLVYPEM